MEARLGKIWIPENRYFGLASTKDYNLDHYDFRFFKDITKDDQAHHLAILHRLMRVWFRLCLQFNIPSWINHGSIIGWYFNGLSLPWDADIDVQVPIQSLYKLSKTINNTLIYDYTDFGTFEFGLRGFYFDVNENFLLRNQIGNPNVNNIDARLIDIESGVYIDITALTDFTSQTNNELITKLLLIDIYQKTNRLFEDFFHNMVHCRNYHYYKIEELTPLIPTYYENTITYLPANFLKNIVIEYDTKSINKLEFNDYKFFKYLQLWISSGDCD
ncbi:uncharacterized protein ASCRUDRAFT_38674, partial [Ascoidea rubescens DSM 1968]